MRTIAKIALVIVLVFVALIGIGATANYLNPTTATSSRSSVLTSSASISTTTDGPGPGAITTVATVNSSSISTIGNTNQTCTGAATVTQNNTTGVLTLCHIVSTYTILNTNTSTLSTYPALSTTSFENNYNVSISYAANPIVRGNNQTIFVKVTQGNTPVINMSLHIHVTYASLQTTKDFDATTNSTGIALTGWLIGGNSNPGLFSVMVTIQGYSYSYNSSFQVNTA